MIGGTIEIPSYMLAGPVHLVDDLAPYETLCDEHIDPRGDLRIAAAESLATFFHVLALGRACTRCAALASK